MNDEELIRKYCALIGRMESTLGLCDDVLKSRGVAPRSEAKRPRADRPASSGGRPAIPQAEHVNGKARPNGRHRQSHQCWA